MVEIMFNLKSLFLGITSILSASVAHADLNFTCKSSTDLPKFEQKLFAKFHDLSISPHYLVSSKKNNTYSVSISFEESNTLQIFNSPYFKVKPEYVYIKGKKTNTVSKKEIAVAYLYKGRVSEFEGDDCGLEKFEDSINLRQKIVAYAQNLSWGWPDGGPAKWNNSLWNKGTPLNKGLTFKALADALTNQSQYEIGCYTATKLVYAQAYADFYKNDKKAPQTILNVLWSDNDPLVDIEPDLFWKFEPDFEAKDKYAAGKLLKIHENVHAFNYIPGDWVYFWNTDPITYQKTGYEGSNAIYLGGNKFNDYYNDNEGSYSFEEKLDELIQWKNGVFSRSRHLNKIQPKNIQELYQTATTPENGGYIIPNRLVPRVF